MSEKVRLIGVILISLAIGGNAVRGAIVGIGMTAEVTYVDDVSGLLDDAVGVGDVLVGYYAYNSETGDSNPLGGVGDYWYYNPPYGISLHGDDIKFESDPQSVSFLMEVLDDHTGLDGYMAMSYTNTPLPSGVEVESIMWVIQDYTCTALSSTDLPLVPPVLGDWEINYLSITLGEKGGTCIGGTVTDVWLIPEPGSILVLGLGALSLRRRRKSRSRCR